MVIRQRHKVIVVLELEGRASQLEIRNFFNSFDGALEIPMIDDNGLAHAMDINQITFNTVSKAKPVVHGVKQTKKRKK